MDLGIILNPLHDEGPAPRETFAEVLDTIELADRLGFKSAWITEHHFLRYSRPSACVTLAAAAARTRSIRLGLAVAVIPFHHPIRLAEDLATLDQISGGRVNVGIGRGLFPKEFDGFSIPFDESRERHAEGIELLRLAWTSDEPLSYEGKFTRVKDVVVYPRPYQRPHPPLYQAVVSPGSFEAAVERGFNGLVGAYLTPFEELRDGAFASWNRAREKHGRQDLRAVHNQIVYVAESREEAYRDFEEPVMSYVRASAEIWGAPDDPFWSTTAGSNWAHLVALLRTLTWDDVFDDLIIAGDPEYVGERLAAFADAGVDEVIIYCGKLDYEKTARSLELLAREVMPRLSRDEARKPGERERMAAALTRSLSP